MAYRASNGITTARLTDEEAREHYATAELVRGHFGKAFVTAIRTQNGLGQQFAAAETFYEPVVDLSIDELEDLATT